MVIIDSHITKEGYYIALEKYGATFYVELTSPYGVSISKEGFRNGDTARRAFDILVSEHKLKEFPL